ncbi:MAG: methyltransferase domain-containing protein [Candidatus Thermoplasmatota archaeon]|nr:methyltransferase domain-containing protein [Candidatus Thermoplasmatota archaeon]
MINLRCPKCEKVIRNNVTEVHSCYGRPILQRSRILDFAIDDHYWNQIPREKMPELRSLARTEGCKIALEKYLRPFSDEYTLNYAWDERRADWYPLCSLPEKPVIVDIGAGWGAISNALARLNGEVFSLDSNIETLEFITIRAQENKFSNIKCVHVDPLEKTQLPFNDNTADLVVMNGVLEWVGMAVDEQDPMIYQKKTLSEISRVLKKGGSLYIGIESRFGFLYWFGKHDHRGTRFTSILPRKVASIITKRKNLGEYRTYTHSARMLKKMLINSGFESVQFYTPFPEYRNPKRIVPIDKASVFRSGLFKTGISKKQAYLLFLASFFGLHKYLVNDYSIVARK